MFRRHREMLERLDRLELQVHERLRALGVSFSGLERSLAEIATTLNEVREDGAVEAQALRGDLAAATAPLAAAHELDVVRTAVRETANQVRELGVATAQAGRSLQERSTEIAALRADLAAAEKREIESTAEIQGAIQKASEKATGGFVRMESRIDALPSREDVQSLGARVDALDRRLGAVHGRISTLVEENAQALAKPSAEIESSRAQLTASVAELKEWWRRVESTTQQSLTALRRTASEWADENVKLREVVKSAGADVRMASQDMATKLSSAIDRHLAAEVVPKIEAMLADLTKLLNRLEARGASTYKTTLAKIVENMKKKRVWGEKHIPWDSALTSLSSSERELGDEALRELIRAGVVSEKPTAGGSHVSLNPQRPRDVDRVIDGEDLSL